MKCEVKLIVAGRVFSEIVEANGYDAARRTALARNPTATVISTNAVFDKPDTSWVHNDNTPSNVSSNNNSGGSSTASIGDTLTLAVVGGGLLGGVWVLVTLTPWIFASGGAVIGAFTGKCLPKEYKTSASWALAIILGITGFGVGQNLYNEWNSDSITNKTEQISYYS